MTGASAEGKLEIQKKSDRQRGKEGGEDISGKRYFGRGVDLVNP